MGQTAIMFDESKRTENIAKPVRATRQALKLNLQQYKLHNKKYSNSPYFRGKRIWDKLPRGIQQLPCKIACKNKIKLKYVTIYENDLDQDCNTSIHLTQRLNPSCWLTLLLIYICI